MIRVAASNCPVDVAWAAFDSAALRLNRLYQRAGSADESAADREQRKELSIEVVQLWDVWRALFLARPSGDAA